VGKEKQWKSQEANGEKKIYGEEYYHFETI
jgi:hypothetical protein